MHTTHTTHPTTFAAPAPVALAPLSTYDHARAALPQWEPVIRPVFLADGTEAGRAVCRPSGAGFIPLATVGAEYSPITHESLAHAFAQISDAVGADGTAITSSVYRDGRVVRLSAEIRALDFDVRGEPYRVRLETRSSHDASAAVVSDLQILRLVCTNGLMAWGSFLPSVRITHTRTGEWRLGRAIDSIRGTVANGIGSAVRWLDAASKLQISAATADQIMADVLEIKAGVEATHAQDRKRSEIVDLVRDRDGQYVPAADLTALALFEAATAYDIHKAPVRRRDGSQGTDQARRELALMAGHSLGAKVRAALTEACPELAAAVA